jgi:hypothetical protein
MQPLREGRLDSRVCPSLLHAVPAHSRAPLRYRPGMPPNRYRPPMTLANMRENGCTSRPFTGGSDLCALFRNDGNAN